MLRAALPFPKTLDRLDPPLLLGRHIDGGRGQRRMSEVLLCDLDRHPSGDRVAGVRVGPKMGSIQKTDKTVR